MRWMLFDRFVGAFEPLRHPGTLLFVSLLGAAAIQRATPAQLRAALHQAVRQLAPVVVALIAVLAVSRLMVHAGMISTLAVAVAHGTGPVWALLAPFAGVLGAFVPGSATASNILFSDFQAVHAELDVPRALGAQGFGAAAGNMIAPMNVVAGAATVELVGREGEDRLFLQGKGAHEAVLGEMKLALELGRRALERGIEREAVERSLTQTVGRSPEASIRTAVNLVTMEWVRACGHAS
jgi:lactate permease